MTLQTIRMGTMEGEALRERVGRVTSYIPSFFHLTKASPTKKVLNVLCPVLLTCHETGWQNSQQKMLWAVPGPQYCSVTVSQSLFVKLPSLMRILPSDVRASKDFTF